MAQGQSLPVEDVSRDVVSIPGNAPLDQVAETMYSEDVGFLVVTHEGEPAGALTDRQVALSLRNEADPSSTTANELMTPDLVTVDRDMDVLRILQQMKLEEIRRVLVVDDDGDPVSVVSLDDVLVLLGEEMGDIADLIEAQV
ncbi:CBS domain protein [Halarchaeum acidiphilum MH1-52-1]|uniref:CBS domain protein n=1 Tax=Halarchaeum acidiphilum MH1-52-1 TaxID=1261545 RepID=U3A964_9EURY|nr:CBS domain-containing protein [Halarchaeum acidiphilum]GAD51293.1 CBS domain protein [Halarchaeum acidiphilum MH1-52-1]